MSLNFRNKSLRSILHQYDFLKKQEEYDAWGNYDIDQFFKKKGEDMFEIVPKRQRLAGKDFGLTMVIQMDNKQQACPISNSDGGLVSCNNSVTFGTIYRC
jgi:hypothetical protein